MLRPEGAVPQREFAGFATIRKRCGSAWISTRSSNSIAAAFGSTASPSFRIAEKSRGNIVRSAHYHRCAIGISFDESPEPAQSGAAML